jgi:hypothetical protein
MIFVKIIISAVQALFAVHCGGIPTTTVQGVQGRGDDIRHIEWGNTWRINSWLHADLNGLLARPIRSQCRPRQPLVARHGRFRYRKRQGE